MKVQDIILIVLGSIAIICTGIFMVKKGIRPNSPLAKMLGRKYVCQYQNCHAPVKSNDINSYCSFHNLLIKAEKDHKKSIEAGEKSPWNIKKIHEGLKLDGKDITKKIKNKYSKNNIEK